MISNARFDFALTELIWNKDYHCKSKNNQTMSIWIFEKKIYWGDDGIWAWDLSHKSMNCCTMTYFQAVLLLISFKKIKLSNNLNLSITISDYETLTKNLGKLFGDSRSRNFLMIRWFSQIPSVPFFFNQNCRFEISVFKGSPESLTAVPFHSPLLNWLDEPSSKNLSI